MKKIEGINMLLFKTSIMPTSIILKDISTINIFILLNTLIHAFTSAVIFLTISEECRFKNFL